MNDFKYSVYIVECSDHTYYTGTAIDVTKRIATHNRGDGAKYTKTRRPVKLVASLGGLTRSEALRHEYKVKRQPKKDKVRYLMGGVDDGERGE